MLILTQTFEGAQLWQQEAQSVVCAKAVSMAVGLRIELGPMLPQPQLDIAVNTQVMRSIFTRHEHIKLVFRYYLLHGHYKTEKKASFLKKKEGISLK